MISFSVAKYSLSTYIKEELKNTYRRVIATIEGPVSKAICSNIKGHLHPYAVAFNGLVLYIINFSMLSTFWRSVRIFRHISDSMI